jgi:hypothetical protein
MRLTGLGLALAMLFSLAAPLAARAADPAITKDARTKGMAAAPALISAAHVDCDLVDARLIGEGQDPKTKTKQSLYEVACKDNEGAVLVKAGDEVTPFSCLQSDRPQADGKPSNTRCLLPGNADPNAGLAPYIAKAGIKCVTDKVRAIGQSPSNAFFEISCTNAPGGFILQTSSPMSLKQPAVADPCIAVSENDARHCQLTDRAAQLGVVDKLAAASGKPCVIKPDGRAYVGKSAAGKMFFEVACQDGKGYLLVQNPEGGLEQAIACVDADAVAGGCKLTDSREAKTEQAGLYSQLAKKAGFDCNVAGYAPLPGTRDMPDDEVVELKCSNRQDGAIAFFPASASQKGGVYDCAHSELFGYRCSLTKAAAAYASLTSDLRSVGKTECVVSSAREVGVTSDKKGFIEVGCSDGLQGYMLEYQIAPPAPLSVTTSIICSQASGIAGGCTLPGNTKKG